VARFLAPLNWLLAHSIEVHAVLTEEDQIVAAIRQIIRAIDLHSRRLMEGHGLTGPQLVVLQEIARQGPLAPSNLARAVHLSQATVTGIVQRLERRELVERAPSSSDRRSVALTVTDAGQELLRVSPSLLQDRFRDSLSKLQQWERLQILATLQRVAGLMDAGDLDAAPHLIPGEFSVPAEPGAEPAAESAAEPAATQPPARAADLTAEQSLESPAKTTLELSDE